MMHLKHVEFYSKNKFEKLAHLFGFIIRIYHYARSPERQIRDSLCGKTVGYKLIVLNLCDAALQNHIYIKHNVSTVFNFTYLHLV